MIGSNQGDVQSFLNMEICLLECGGLVYGDTLHGTKPLSCHSNGISQSLLQLEEIHD